MPASEALWLMLTSTGRLPKCCCFASAFAPAAEAYVIGNYHQHHDDAYALSLY
jgi:hypothetical protein